METGIMLLTGGATITKVMDLIGNMLPEKYRRLIPVIAMAFGIGRMLLSPELSIAEVISQGISMGLGAVGIHVVTKKKEEVPVEKAVEDVLPSNTTTDENTQPYMI